MKKVLATLCALFIAVSVMAQSEYAYNFMRFYVPDNNGSPFPLPVDTYFVMSENGATFLKVHANYSYNAVEMQGYQKYAIPVGNNLYLKLDNDTVITLTCSRETNIKDGYITTNNGIYQNYAGYSYFQIDDTIVDNLTNHDIIKIRGQFKFETMDGSLQFTPETETHKTKNEFIKAIEYVRQKYNAAINEKDSQNKLKQNPLYGF